jgi:hypothetical protein
MEKLGATVSLTSRYQPQSKGQVERTNQELRRFLRSHCQDQQGEWTWILPWAEYTQKSLCYSSTGLTPFHYVLVYQLAQPLWTPSQTEAPAVDKFFRNTEEVWNATHVRLQLAVRHQKDQAHHHRSEAPVFNPGDRVWLSTRNLPVRLPCWKLSTWFLWPFKVLQRINEVTYHLQLPTNYRISPSFHVSLLRPVVPGPLADPVPCDTPPPPLDIDGSHAYAVRPQLDSWGSWGLASVPGGLGGDRRRGTVPLPVWRPTSWTPTLSTISISAVRTGPLLALGAILLGGVVLLLEPHVGGTLSHLLPFPLSGAQRCQSTDHRSWQPKLRTPGNHYYTHLLSIVMHTCTSSLP